MENSLKKNLIFQIMYQCLLVITPIITSPYLSRKLGVINLGIFSSTYSYISIFVLFSKLGVDAYGCREIARCKNNTTECNMVFWEIYLIQIISSLFTIGIFIIIVLFYKNLDYPIYFIAQGLWIVAAFLDIN